MYWGEKETASEIMALLSEYNIYRVGVGIVAAVQSFNDAYLCSRHVLG